MSFGRRSTRYVWNKKHPGPTADVVNNDPRHPPGGWKQGPPEKAIHSYLLDINKGILRSAPTPTNPYADEVALEARIAGVGEDGALGAPVAQSPFVAMDDDDGSETPGAVMRFSRTSTSTRASKLTPQEQTLRIIYKASTEPDPDYTDPRVVGLDELWRQRAKAAYKTSASKRDELAYKRFNRWVVGRPDDEDLANMNRVFGWQPPNPEQVDQIDPPENRMGLPPRRGFNYTTLHPSIAAYADELVQWRVLVAARLEQLKRRGPSNIEEAWLYWKYILNESYNWWSNDEIFADFNIRPFNSPPAYITEWRRQQEQARERVASQANRPYQDWWPGKMRAAGGEEVPAGTAAPDEPPGVQQAMSAPPSGVRFVGRGKGPAATPPSTGNTPSVRRSLMPDLTAVQDQSPARGGDDAGAAEDTPEINTAEDLAVDLADIETGIKQSEENFKQWETDHPEEAKHRRALVESLRRTQEQKWALQKRQEELARQFQEREKAAQEQNVAKAEKERTAQALRDKFYKDYFGREEAAEIARREAELLAGLAAADQRRREGVAAAAAAAARERQQIEKRAQELAKADAARAKADAAARASYQAQLLQEQQEQEEQDAAEQASGVPADNAGGGLFTQFLSGTGSAVRGVSGMVGKAGAYTMGQTGRAIAQGAQALANGVQSLSPTVKGFDVKSDATGSDDNQEQPKPKTKPPPRKPKPKPQGKAKPKASGSGLRRSGRSNAGKNPSRQKYHAGER